jgi:cell fate regulator YaaT (PSP1 superfamily)
MNVFNWLADLPLSDPGKPFPIIEVSFNNGSRKDFYRNTSQHIFQKMDWVTVEGTGGYDVGQISLTGELVKLQMKKYGVSEAAELKRVLRPSIDRDLELYKASKEREKDTLIRSRAIAKQLNLEMKIAEAEFQADGKKVTFFYTADARVDFRELIKVFAAEFKAKVEMRQIGARQESAKVGGIGSCGRELCCSTWLTDFKTVNTTAARYQNLSINQTKLSGQCGRLKCCLNYELDTYMDALKVFPDNVDAIEVAAGKAFLQKKDIFRNVMWYSFAGSSKQYPLDIERVKEIAALNARGEKPDELEAVEIQTRQKTEKSIDVGFVNDVGQLTLSSLSRGDKKRKKNKSQQQNKATESVTERDPASRSSRNRGLNPSQPVANTSEQMAPQEKQVSQKKQHPKPNQGNKQPKPGQNMAGSDRQDRREIKKTKLHDSPAETNKMSRAKADNNTPNAPTRTEQTQRQQKPKRPNQPLQNRRPRPPRPEGGAPKPPQEQG